jgi:hypothetical protein
MEIANKRTVLMSRVVSKFASKREAAEAYFADAAARAKAGTLPRKGSKEEKDKKGSSSSSSSSSRRKQEAASAAAAEASSQPPRREPIDMVQARRKLYVSAKLLPPRSNNQTIKEMKASRAAEARAKGEKAAEKAFVVDEEAHAESALLSDLVHGNDTTGGDEAAAVVGGQSSLERSREIARRRLLEAQTVHYGKGRLTTAHNLKGPIGGKDGYGKGNHPWMAVPGYYSASLPI